MMPGQASYHVVVIFTNHLMLFAHLIIGAPTGSAGFTEAVATTQSVDCGGVW